MNKLIKIIGSVVYASFMYSIPILLTCSMLLKWDNSIQFILWFTAATQFSKLCFDIYDKVEVGK